ncbi:MAG: hypothetical protein WDO16_02610 [Bacteroidota bacterium]
MLTLLATIVSIAITPGILKIFSDFMPPELTFTIAERPASLFLL